MFADATAPKCRVYRRTPKGAAAVLSQQSTLLEKQPRRLLLIVNGFTPISDLTGLAHFPDEALHIADALEELGLIEEVDDALIENGQRTRLFGEQRHYGLVGCDAGVTWRCITQGPSNFVRGPMQAFAFYAETLNGRIEALTMFENVSLNDIPASHRSR